MKVRVLMIEADDVQAEDVGVIAARLLQPALPVAASAPALPRPPSVPTQMADMNGWHAHSRRKRAARRGTTAARGQRQEHESARTLRPESPEMVQCKECGESLPEGKDRRSPCAKCGAHSWETIPARHTEIEDDEP